MTKQEILMFNKLVYCLVRWRNCRRKGFGADRSPEDTREQ